MQKFFTFPIDPVTDRMLRRLAKIQDRSRAAVLRTLVRDADKGAKGARPAEPPARAAELAPNV